MTARVWTRWPRRPTRTTCCTAWLKKLRPVTRGACAFCAKAHGVSEQVTAGGRALLEECKRHASVRNLVVDGYQILSF